MIKNIMLMVFITLGVLCMLTAKNSNKENLEKIYDNLQKKYKRATQNHLIIVKVSEQKMYVFKDNKIIKDYDVSTSKYGIGNKSGSNKTPSGTHQIIEKSGENSEIGAIFRWGKDTGKKIEIIKEKIDDENDYITTRVMKLKGLEPGKNSGKGIDSYQRGIWIHGTHEEGLIGNPVSHGCIRMRNNDVVELFNLVKINTIVEIIE